MLSTKHQVPPASFLLLEATLMPIAGDVGVAWTLQHEILFYIVFAITILNRHIGTLVFSGWLAFLIGTWAGYLPQYDIPILSRLSSPVDIEFFFGMTAAYFLTSGHIKNFKIYLWIGFISFLAFGLAENMKLFDGYASSARLAYGLSSMMIVIGITGVESRQSFRLPKFLVVIGSASYSIYLFHLVCIGVAYKLLEVSGVRTLISINLQYVILVLAGVGGGVVLSRVIEFPLINLVRKLRERYSASPLRYPEMDKSA